MIFNLINKICNKYIDAIIGFIMQKCLYVAMHAEYINVYK